MTITRELILSYRTPRGGWSRRTLTLLGVPWPPREGWMREIVGGTLTPEQVKALDDDKEFCKTRFLRWEFRHGYRSNTQPLDFDGEQVNDCEATEGDTKPPWD